MLNARAGEHGSVLLSVASTSSMINFIGASCPASVGPITHGLTSVTVAPQKGKKGLVALQVWHKPIGGHDPNRDLCYLLPTTHDSRPFVELADPFIPTADCLAQLMDSGLLVTVGDKKFIAPNFCSDNADGLAEMKALWAKQETKVVNDPNLLCRFLVGDATLEEVSAVAKASQLAEDLPAKYAALESVCAELEKAITKIEARRYTAASCARIVIARAMELQKMAEAMITTAQWAKFGNRKKNLEIIAGCAKDAQASRLHLVHFKNTIPPEKNGE